MRLRSLLFVPGDSERKFEKARACGADGLILDLEDAVAPSRKADARLLVARFLADKTSRDWAFWVRVNPFESGLTLDDLAAVVEPGLSGIVLPKANGARMYRDSRTISTHSKRRPASRPGRLKCWLWPPRRRWPCSILARTRRRIRDLRH